MVVTSISTQFIDRAKAFKFIALSIALNLGLASSINFSSNSLIDVRPSSIRVSLNSISSSSVSRIEKKKIKSNDSNKKIVTKKNALEKISTKPKEKDPQLAKPSEKRNGINNGTQASSVVHEPTYRYQTPPIYPNRALDLGWQGIVTLHAKVSKDGLPKELKIAKSSGHKILDMAAFSAVKKWEFEPLNIGGNIQESWVKIPVRFAIN